MGMLALFIKQEQAQTSPQTCRYVVHDPVHYGTGSAHSPLTARFSNKPAIVTTDHVCQGPVEITTHGTKMDTEGGQEALYHLVET